MKFLYMLCCLVILTSCRVIKPANEIIKLDGPKWTLTAIKHRAVTHKGNAYLQFSPKLEVKGKAFCNSIAGDYELMGKDQLTFQKLISTKMYCDGLMDQESEMISNLENVKRYEIKNQMLYLYNSDELLLTFRKDD